MIHKIGFIGVGNMGAPMAQNLIDNGFELSIYDKDSSRAENLFQSKAKVVKNLLELISENSTIITMLPDDTAIKEVFLGKKGIIKNLRKDQIHILMCTVSPEIISKLYKAHTINGSQLVTAPVLGRPEAAASKKLWILLGGVQKAKEKVIPILNMLGQKIFDFGEDITSTSHVKLAINFLVLSAIESIGESVDFIKKTGLDASLFAGLITEILFDCTAYKYHANNIVEQKFSPAGFKLSLGLKDAGLLKKSAEELNVHMPVLNILIKKLFLSIEQKRENLDWAAITLNCLEDSGILLKGDT